MGDADLETLVREFLKHRNFDKFVKSLVEEGHSQHLPAELVADRRRAIAKAKLERAQAEYKAACK